MSNSVSFYKHSGRFSPRVFLHLLWFFVSVPVLALLYVVYAHWMPYIYLIALGTLAFIIVISVLFRSVLRRGLVRSRLLAVVLGFLVGVYSVYCVWVAYVSVVVMHWSVVILSPLDLFSYARIIALLEPWTVSLNFLPSLPTLPDQPARSVMEFFIVWVVEAVTIVTGCIWIGFSIYSDDSVYCEHCSEWAESVGIGKFLDKGDSEYLKQCLLGGNEEVLLRLLPANQDSSHFLVVTLFVCSRRDTRYVSISRWIVLGNKFKITSLLKYLKISEKLASSLLEIKNAAPV